jgi:hypothetical protein
MISRRRKGDIKVMLGIVLMTIGLVFIRTVLALVFLTVIGG